MSFELNTRMSIKSVKAYCKEKEARILRRCKLRLSAPFSEEIAAALGGDAEKARKALDRMSFDSAVIPIDSIIVGGALKCGDQSTLIAEMVGTKATAKCGTEEGDDTEGTPPTITLEFDLTWKRDPWLFLGEHYGSECDVTFASVQADLPGTEKKEAKNGASNGHAKREAAPKAKRGRPRKQAELKVDRDEGETHSDDADADDTKAAKQKADDARAWT